MKFCAFLRGVNVKGTNMKMADVCKVFEDVGMKNVISVLASGNIIFSSEKNVEELKPLLEKAMSNHFDYEAFLLLNRKLKLQNVLKIILFRKMKVCIFTLLSATQILKIL